MQVKDIPEGMTLVTDSQEVDNLKVEAKCFVSVNESEVDACNAFFVETKDGEYTKIYGVESSIPKNDEEVYEFMSVPVWNEQSCESLAWQIVESWDHKDLMRYAADRVAQDYKNDESSFMEEWYNNNKMQ